MFGEDEDVTLTWMTGPVKCVSSMKRFAEILGYPFLGDITVRGKRMHVDGVAYNKKRVSPLYEKEESIGTNKDLRRVYNILLRLFWCNIAPPPSGQCGFY